MVWRSLSVFCFMMVAQAAIAQDALQQQAPFTAQTVKQFLDDCGHDMSQCDFEIRSALLNKLVQKNATSVCLKDAHYQEPAIAWLKAHTETWPMATEDGIYIAFKTLYPCS